MTIRRDWLESIGRFLATHTILSVSGPYSIGLGLCQDFDQGPSCAALSQPPFIIYLGMIPWMGNAFWTLANQGLQLFVH
jgi:hypothetical protein